jgi:carbon monoxide dehydrogenase subunit G
LDDNFNSLLIVVIAEGEFTVYKFQKSIFINRSQQDVFDFLTNPANLQKWATVVEFAEWTSTGTPGIGSTYKQVVKFLGRNSETVFEISSWDPPNRYGYRSINIPPPAESIESVITLAPKENGTQLTFEAQLGAIGIFKFAEGMLGKMAEKGDGNNIDTLKQLLEAAP